MASPRCAGTSRSRCPRGTRSPRVTMNAREGTARAVAFFESCDDIALLHRAIEDVAPRAKRMVARHLASATEEAIPPPAELRGARDPADERDAIATVRSVDDFGL